MGSCAGGQREECLFATKPEIPHLRRAGAGSILNLSSIARLIGIGGIARYHASKGAVRLMSKDDAITYAFEKIWVNSIHPAYIWTPMVENHCAPRHQTWKLPRLQQALPIRSAPWANPTK